MPVPAAAKIRINELRIRIIRQMKGGRRLVWIIERELTNIFSITNEKNARTKLFYHFI